MPNKFKPIDFEIDENGCFNCISHAPMGYGYRRITNKGVNVYIHRFVYEQMFGQIPEGLLIRHKCDNPACINPEHLETGTQTDNMHDMYNRGRHPVPKGEEKCNSKLTDEEVKDIKELLKVKSQRELAGIYGVSRWCIRAIKNGKTWKHVV